VTTLHGTDITLVGSDPSYAETIGFSIDQSDGVTAVSESLKADTYKGLPVTHDIRVIPNFLDCRIHHRVEAHGLRERFAGSGRAVVIHVSNFRPVKRVDVVVDVFARIRAEVPAVLLLVGDGPDLPHALARARELRIAGDVVAVGEQQDVRQFLSIADLFLLPSATESFGLAALEAMACQVPVVASRVGGLPEVIENGVSGFLHHPDDVQGMAASGIAVLTDRERRDGVVLAGRRLVDRRFCSDKVVPVYEQFYEEILAAPVYEVGGRR
jgi:N-acetyl-alpha-D-glucosaminyl L-malate synthase BshA